MTRRRALVADRPGETLAQLIARSLPGTDPEAARALVSAGQVFVAGRRASRSEVLAPGTRVIVHVGTVAPAPEGAVLYEDDRILVIDKPPGVHVNETETTARRSLAAQLAERGALAVHRIDRDTSGLVVMAREPRAAEALGAAFAERRVAKRYAAVTRGRPPEGTVAAPIGPDRRRPRARAVHPAGKPAETRLEVLSEVEGLAAVLAEPRTGRTHQIRVHLSHLGAPILGDTLYGGPAAVRLAGRVLEPGRVLLHAARLEFRLDGRDHAFEAGLPPDLAALVPLGLALDRVYR